MSKALGQLRECQMHELHMNISCCDELTSVRVHLGGAVSAVQVHQRVMRMTPKKTHSGCADLQVRDLAIFYPFDAAGQRPYDERNCM